MSSASESSAQTELPDVDLASVRRTLAGFIETYSERVARAESGAEVAQLVHDYATACLTALEGVATFEAEALRAYYRDMLVGVEAAE
jgi:hypothetical protein